MSDLYLTSDPHLGHERCNVKWRGFDSNEEFTELFIDNWNRTVTKWDTVWVLGDILFGGHSVELFNRMNGLKHLILGNHDNKSIHRYAEGFSKIKATECLRRKFVLSHIPVHPSSLDCHGLVNIHGHIHISNTGVSQPSPDPSNLYYNVNCELHDYAPVPFDKIREHFRGLI